jgi:hypothetical protein
MGFGIITTDSGFKLNYLLKNRRLNQPDILGAIININTASLAKQKNAQHLFHTRINKRNRDPG